MVTIESLIKEVENLGSNIRAEIIDGGLRVSGNTYPVKGRLKFLGFQWDPRRREWYYDAQENDPDRNEFEFLRE